MNENKPINKTEHLKKLYAAPEIIAENNSQIEKLYRSAAGNGDKSIIAKQAAELQMINIALIRQSINLIKFSFTLMPEKRKILEMRCEKGMSWKEIAATLNISEKTAISTFRRIECETERYGGIF